MNINTDEVDTSREAVTRIARILSFREPYRHTLDQLEYVGTLLIALLDERDASVTSAREAGADAKRLHAEVEQLRLTTRESEMRMIQDGYVAGRRRALEEAAQTVISRIPEHSTKQRLAYRQGNDRLGEYNHAKHVEAFECAEAIRALSKKKE